MTPIDRRRLVLGSGLLGVAAVAAMVRPVRPARRLAAGALDRAIPVAVPGYRAVTTGTVVLPPEDATSTLIYDGLLVRGYAPLDARTGASADVLSLVIAYGATQDYTLQLHRPESCYPASGFSIDASEPMRLTLGGAAVDARTLQATRGAQRERLLYWTRIGRDFPVTLWQQRALIAAAAWRRRIADGVLVRLSMADTGDAAPLARFAQALVAASPPAGRAFLLGSARL